MGKLIGITAGEIFNRVDEWSPITHGQANTYNDALIEAGGAALILPITNDPATLKEVYDHVGGLLVAGGNDINPALYGEEARSTTTDVSVFRDNYEELLVSWALRDQKPILGICRGMQMINLVLGGTLYQHIPTDIPGAEDHTTSTTAKDVEHLAHTLRLDASSKLAAIVGSTTIKTNAHHHQAIKEMGEGLRAVAWTDDNVIEAVEGTGEQYIIGVQSHPESLVFKAQRAWLALFASFVEAVEN